MARVQRGSVSILAFMLAAAGPVWAQQLDAEGDEEASRERKLATVTVTAQRTEETLQNAAIPINAATGDELIGAGVTDATLLNKISPALYVANTGGANTAYFVRGVGNFTNNGYTAPAIAFNIDGVYIGRTSSTISSFLDLNRVEVLKGPQGTLYGRNATGGAVNVIPNAPVIGDTSAHLTAGAGNYSSYEFTGIANFAVGSASAIRLAGTAAGHDGYVDDGTGTAEDLAFRAQFLTELSSDLSVRLSADYSSQNGTGPGLLVKGVYTFAPFQGNLPVPNRPFIQPTGDPLAGLHDPAVLQFIRQFAVAAPLFSPVEEYSYPSRNDSYWGVNAEIKWDLGPASLVVIPAYRNSRLDSVVNGPPFKGAMYDDEAEQYSLEARINGSAGGVDYLLGGYYFDETVKGENSFNQFATVTYNDFDSQVRSTAVFGRATFHATDSLRFVAGIRYTEEERDFYARSIAAAGVCLIPPVAGPPSCPQVPTIPVGLTAADSLAALNPALLTGPPLAVLLSQIANNAPGVPAVTPYGPFGPTGPQAILSFTPTVVDDSASDKEVTYRLAVEYDLSPDHLLYASYETGFRAGGFNQSFGNEIYDPEYIKAFTIGSKNRFFDDTFELNAELFYWDYEDQQLAALGLDARGANSFFTRNVGSSSIKGIDIDSQFAATANTLLRGSIQYLDAKYDDFVFSQRDLSAETDPPNFQTPITGCDFTQTGVDGDPSTPRAFTIDCSGKQALYAPKWTIGAGIQHTIPLSRFDLTGSLDVRYRSEREVGFNYLPGSRLDAVVTADAAVTLAPNNANWSFTAYVRNLTDEVVPVIYQLGAANVTVTSVEPPRIFGARLTLDF